jgi:tetratricopeptide (TPR) repeat protein
MMPIQKTLSIAGRRARRGALFAALAVSLTGCGAVSELGAISEQAFQDRSPHVELGIAELAKGNFLEAETRFDRALVRNPDDPYALLAKAILFQSTERNDSARILYERLIKLAPDSAATIGDWSNLRPQNVVEIAKANLLRMELNRTHAAATPGSDSMASMAAPSAAPTMSPPQPFMPTARKPLSMAGLSAGERNVLQRFELMRMLRDGNLVTEQEHAARRAANVGALLPLTEDPPAAGLGRPVPPPDQVRERLEALGRSLQSGAVTPREQQAERTLILDAILPAEPERRAPSTLPPTDIMAAAAGVGKLERLRGADLIDDDEYTREREAIEAAIRRATVGATMQPKPRQSAVMEQGSAETAPKKVMPDEAAAPTSMAAARPTRPSPGVHLASYRSRAAAEKGWAALSASHKALLGNYRPFITRVDLGSGKGIYFRLFAGPLADTAAANSLCGQLRERRQYCRPGSVNPADA